MQIVEQLSKAMEGPVGLNWRQAEPTQAFLQALRGLVGAAQDSWLVGNLQSSRELELAEQASANTLAQVIEAIEQIRMPEPKENVDGPQ